MQYVSGSKVVSGKSISISTHLTTITNDKVIISLKFANGSIGSLLYTADASNKLEKKDLNVMEDQGRNYKRF